MAADCSRLGAQIVRMVSVLERMAISTLLDAPRESERRQSFLEQNVMFAGVEESKIELESEHSMISFLSCQFN